MGENREKDLTLLRRASELKNAFACSKFCDQVWSENKEETFRFAQLAASQHERDGFYLLGFCFRKGVGCEKDVNLAKENLLIAAELGYVWAAQYYGDLLGESDPVRWIWLSRAALRRAPGSFLHSFSTQVN